MEWATQQQLVPALVRSVPAGVTMRRKWGAQRYQKRQRRPDTDSLGLFRESSRCNMNPWASSSLQTARLVGAHVQRSALDGFLVPPGHSGNKTVLRASPLQFNPEPEPELGKCCHSSKTGADRRVHIKKGDHTSNHKRDEPRRPV